MRSFFRNMKCIHKFPDALVDLHPSFEVDRNFYLLDPEAYRIPLGLNRDRTASYPTALSQNPCVRFSRTGLFSIARFVREQGLIPIADDPWPGYPEVS